jgi:hypothetical protein
MILFLSQYSGQQEAEYDTGKFGIVTGAQTNEAPVKYAIARINAKGDSLERIIALVTPKARETALAMFTKSVKTVNPKTKIKDVDIGDAVTTVELFNAIIGALFPIPAGDTVIIETTGGLRNSITPLTLLSRFLRYIGVEVEFSTYADNFAKTVGDTHEADELWELLDAVNLFAVTGNPAALSKTLKNIRDIPEKQVFMAAIREFYDTILCCKMSKIEEVVGKLRMGFKSMSDACIPDSDPKLLVFRDLVREILEAKMAFIHEEEYLIGLVGWCKENGLIQQAITILYEKIVKPGKLFGYMDADRLVLRFVRHNFSHADGEVEIKTNQIKDEKQRQYITEQVKMRLDNVNNLLGLIDRILNRIRKANCFLEKGRETYEQS